MQTEEFVESFTNAGKASYEAMQKLGDINTKALQKLTDIQFSLASLGIESGVEQVNLINNSSNYKDLLSAESNLASDYSSKVFEITRQAADVLSESREEVSDWMKTSMSFAAETKKPKTTKAKTKAPAKRTRKAS